MAMPMLEQVERPVPYDISAEEAVLGSLLLDRDAIIKVAPFLHSDDFYREAHGLIYQAVLDLYGRREPGDAVTLSAELERNGRLLQQALAMGQGEPRYWTAEEAAEWADMRTTAAGGNRAWEYYTTRPPR